MSRPTSRVADDADNLASDGRSGKSHDRLTGVATGLLVAGATTQLVRGMLYGITPLDGTTYAASAALTIFIALFACALPAYRAAHLDPLKVLRSE